MKLILASASPRRRELIKSLSFLDVEFQASEFDESIIKSDKPDVYASLMAYCKASEVFRRMHCLTLGVDTVVSLENRILGKPCSANDAFDMLKRLSAKTHEVISGFCLMSDRKVIVDYERTFVTFDNFTDEFIEKYIESGSCFDKAGAYGIQDAMIKSKTLNIDGDYNNVVGLPLEKLKKILMENERNGAN